MDRTEEEQLFSWGDILISLRRSPIKNSKNAGHYFFVKPFVQPETLKKKTIIKEFLKA
jgi:hypothetical protein